MNASLREIVLAVRFGEASLVGESVGYLILGACDRAVAVPRAVDLDGVLLTGEGEVVLDASEVSPLEAEQSLRTLLGQLLTLLRAPFPNLARVAAREPCGLPHLITELEAALVPVNRRAARRSLSRLVREARRSGARDHAALAVTELDIAPPPAPPAMPAGPAVAPPVGPAAAPVARAVAPPGPAPATFVQQEWAPVDAFDVDVAVDEVPSLCVEPVTQVPARTEAAAFSPSPSPSPSHFPGHEPAFASDFEPLVEADVAPQSPAPEPASPAPAQPEPEAVDDAFDHALTRVASAVETLPPPETRPRSSFNLRRLAPAPEVEGPLFTSGTPSTVRPSSIEDLLLCMRIEGEPTEVLLADLAQLARVDVSPAAPPVG